MQILQIMCGTEQRSYVKALGMHKWVRLIPGHRVRIHGRLNDFIVLQVHQQTQAADLLQTGSLRKVELGVPLKSIDAIIEPAPEDDSPLTA